MRLAASALVGAILGVAIGYQIYLVTRPNPVALIEWLTRANLGAVDWIIWALIGAGVAAELCLRRNRRT